MFESLSQRLGGVFDSLTGRGVLKEEDVNRAMREIRIALLEADVALPVAKDFIEKVRSRAVGETVLKSVKPGEQVVKIVHDTLVETLSAGEGEEELNLAAKPPVPILMVGLQGGGKTTTTAKLGKFLTEKQRKKTLMASLDVYRPAAQEQLAILGEQIGVDTLEIIPGQKPDEITRRAMESARLGGYEVVILDTAGRLSIDQDLMDEVKTVRDISKPAETLLVVDAMTGQDAVSTAENFNEQIGISGVVLTRVDGDARGGAALSMRAVTGKPIKFMGVGETTDALQPFHADRIADRILDMGDVVSLVEKAAETIEQDEAEAMARKMAKGKFDLDDFAQQLKQMRKMGGMSGLMGMLPGMGKLKSMIGDAEVDDGLLVKQEAILSSMTKNERANPKLMNASRRKRIAAGSGTDVQDVNRLLKQFQQMQSVMKKMKKMGGGNLMKGMGKMFGGGDMPDMDEMSKQMGADMPGSAEDPAGLGPNPFAQGGGGMGGLGGGAGGLGAPGGMGGGMPPGLPGMPSGGGGTPKKMNKRKKKQAEKARKKGKK
ncbi:MAG: signal recognition particle protein [Pseudomonadota bacterium]